MNAARLAFAILLTFAIVPATEASGRPEAVAPHAPGHVLVKVSSAAGLAVLESGSEPLLDEWRVVPVPAGETALAARDRLVGKPGIEAVELDYVFQLEPSVSTQSVNDPFLDFQWHLPRVQTEAAWAKGTGEGSLVAVLDTGISQGGFDLDCRAFVSPYNAITQTAGLSAADDDNGHGTHVAGTVAQCTDNLEGVAGVARDADLMPVKVLDADGNGNTSWVARGVEWAKDHGADVINMSLSCDFCSSLMLSEAIETAEDAGVVVVGAAGNSSLGLVGFPASHPDVIAVSALDYADDLTWYSNYGSALSVSAPGGDLSADLNGDTLADGVLQETFVGGTFGYYFFEGTSMASPHVAGAAAILKSVAPGAQPGQIREALEETALDLGPPGFDDTFGHGLIQISDAVDYLSTLDTEAPVWAEGASLDVKRYGETELTMVWDAATDNEGVTGYLVRPVGGSGGEVEDLSAVVTGLSAGSTHDVEVLARDQAGNWSQPLSAEVRTAKHFVDVQGHLFYNDILWMSGERITEGCNPPVNDHFCPNDPVTRETMAAFLGRALGLPDGIHPGFGDVAEGSTFERDIRKLAVADITRGCNPPLNDLFCPEDVVTRQTMAAFLVRALDLVEDDHPGFLDVSEENIFRRDIGKLATAEITRGCNPPANDRFCPQDVVTRAQLAAFLRRALGG